MNLFENRRRSDCLYYCLVVLFQETKIDIFKNCINLITIAVPPALPLALSIGLSVSFTRLQTKGIYCINPNRIINAGRVNTLCFDKTGTLTEDGLSLKGVIPVNCGGNQTVPSCGTMEEDLQALYRQGNQVRINNPAPSIVFLNHHWNHTSTSLSISAVLIKPSNCRLCYPRKGILQMIKPLSPLLDYFTRWRRVTVFPFWMKQQLRLTGKIMKDRLMSLATKAKVGRNGCAWVGGNLGLGAPTVNRELSGRRKKS